MDRFVTTHGANLNRIGLEGRIHELFHEEWKSVAARTSRLFVWFLLLQWVVLVVVAGAVAVESRVWPDFGVGRTALAGGVLIAGPIWMAFRRSELLATRFLVATAQVLCGGLLVGVTGGRIEAQFHVFASLAFLAAYRDWRVVVWGTIVAVAEMAIRRFWIEWIFLVDVRNLIGIEQATWIALEVLFLFVAIQHSLTELRAMAERQANLERTNDQVERIIQERTAELRSGERRLKAVYDAVADGIIIVDEQLAIRSLNPSAADLFGSAREDLVGVALTDLIIGAEGLIADALMSAAQSGLMPRPDENGEILGLRRDGSTFPIELSISKTHLGSGLALVGVLRDISDRRKSENALRASEARYRLLFESNPHAMWVAAVPDGRILAVNDSAIAQYGYPRDQFLQMRVADLDPSCADLSHGSIDELRRHRLASGEVRQMELAARPVEFDGQSASLMMAVDVTERKLLEEQLKQAQKLESIGQLAAGIAHEINTPIQYIGDNTVFLSESFRDLNAILLAYRESRGERPALAAADELAQKIELKFLLEEIPNALTQSLEGVRHVAGIVKAMKEFAHPGTVEKTPVDINRTLETVVAVARNEWKYVADIVLRLDPQLPKVLGLPGELNQVFLNLLVNAAHAISSVVQDHKKGTITLTTRRVGGMAEVRIADTGCGIPSAIRSRIFDPFFTTKPIGQGTGQGLAIAHAVVEKKHGGVLSFQSEPGVGTTFIVCLPIQADRLSNSERIHVIESVRVPLRAPPDESQWTTLQDQTRYPIMS